MYAHLRTPDGGPPRNSHAVSAPSLRICRHQSPLSLYADPRPLTRMCPLEPLTPQCHAQHSTCAHKSRIAQLFLSESLRNGCSDCRCSSCRV